MDGGYSGMLAVDAVFDEGHDMPDDPILPGDDDAADSAPLGPETEADVHEHSTHNVDPDDMFDPLGT